MITIHDRADMARIHTLGLADPLKAILIDRIAALSDELIDLTSFIVINNPTDTEADILREAGFSPLVEPFDGHRFGSPGFHPWWDWLRDHGGAFEIAVTFGSAYACHLLVQDSDGILPELLDLCRAYT